MLGGKARRGSRVLFWCPFGHTPPRAPAGRGAGVPPSGPVDQPEHWLRSLSAALGRSPAWRVGEASAGIWCGADAHMVSEFGEAWDPFGRRPVRALRGEVAQVAGTRGSGCGGSWRRVSEDCFGWLGATTARRVGGVAKEGIPKS